MVLKNLFTLENAKDYTRHALVNNINAPGLLAVEGEFQSQEEFDNYRISDLNTKRIVCTGRLSKEKGMYDLLQVFNIVHKLDNSIVLDIFGDGPERNIMEK